MFLICMSGLFCHSDLSCQLGTFLLHLLLTNLTVRWLVGLSACHFDFGCIVFTPLKYVLDMSLTTAHMTVFGGINVFVVFFFYSVSLPCNSNDSIYIVY